MGCQQSRYVAEPLRAVHKLAAHIAGKDAAEPGSPESRPVESRDLGIKLQFVIDNFPGEAQQMAEHLVNDVLPNKSGRSTDEQQLLDRYGVSKTWWNSRRRERELKVEEMSFTELSQIVAHGDVAYGKGLTCPRDGMLDCSIVDAVHAKGHSQPATLYLSFAWGYTLATALSALQNYLVTHPDISGEGCYLWWRFFQDNLFRTMGPGAKAKKESFEELRWSLGRQLRSVGRIAIMSDQLVEPMFPRRSWCVFEACVAIEEQIPIEVMLPENAGTEVDNLLQKGGFKNLEASLEIDAEKAKASSKEDEQGIKKFVAKRAGGYARLNASLIRSMKQSVHVEMCKNLGGLPPRRQRSVRSTVSI
jgi:hypothetical protein